MTDQDTFACRYVPARVYSGQRILIQTEAKDLDAPEPGPDDVQEIIQARLNCRS
jgi:hypothetical protein